AAVRSNGIVSGATLSEARVGGDALLFSGYARPFAEVTLFNSGVPVGTTVASASGDWSVDYASGDLTPDASYNFSAQDDNGMWSSNFPVHFGADADAPQIQNVLA